MSSAKKAINIYDLRRMARERLPRMVFDYIDGGADDEVTLKRSVGRYDDLEFVANVLTNVENIDLTCRVMGHAARLPFLIAPVAANRLFHPKRGETAVANAARRAGAVYACSTMASTPLESLSVGAQTPKWVQLYVWRDIELVYAFMDRAKAAGFEGCILTVDTPVAGNRERDPRNSFSLPPQLSLSLAAQVLTKPRWLWDFLTSGKIEVANFDPPHDDSDVIEFINKQFSNSVTWDDAAKLRAHWDGPFAVKGISSSADALKCMEISADAIWVSNHGGRQLDTAAPSIDLLRSVVEAVDGNADIILDGGVRRGSHIVKALALGATAVAIGRAWLYGLGADGEAGVLRSLEILEAETRRTMALLGVKNLKELTPDLIRFRSFDS
ncbi:MAG: alpha-hydroxy acid oxidase [Pseudomonadota bacterium]